MAVRISREILQHILNRAAASPDAEVCGLLLGCEGEVTDMLPTANVADEPSLRFEIDPAALIAAHRRARSGGPAILGYYHSHPAGEVEPSRCDAEMADADGMLWLICEPRGAWALWRAGNAGLHGRFAPETPNA